MAVFNVVSNVTFAGMQDASNISALCIVGDNIFVANDEATDEGNLLQVFRWRPDSYTLEKTQDICLDVLPGDAKEMDIEGLANDDNRVYVVGSHSRRRPRVRKENPYEVNRRLLMSPPERQPAREVLLRFDWHSHESGGEVNAPTIAARKETGAMERTSLRSFLENNEPFATFSNISSKENGVDIEGLAYWQESLFVGFRGPVLRGNYTPILRCNYKETLHVADLLFLPLQGRGIRDLAPCRAGMLILAGPVGDGPGSYQLYEWNGEDGVPGKGSPSLANPAGLKFVGDLPLDAWSNGKTQLKPESLAVLKESERHWHLLIACDSQAKDKAWFVRVKKP